MESKKVFLHRKEANNHLPEDIQKNADVKLASVYRNRKPLSGLSREEEEELLPQIINVDPDDSNFSEKTEEFWQNLDRKIGSGGEVLEIGTHNGEPINVQDYVFYKFAKEHPQVADTEEDARGNPNKEFWFVDPEREKRAKRNEVSKKQHAWKEFMKLEEDENKVDMMLRVFVGTNPDRLSDRDEKINRLSDALEQDPQGFIETATNDYLEVKYKLLQMLEYDVLRKVGNQIMYMDEVIGETMEEAVAWYRNDKNSKQVAEMNAKLNEATP